MANKDISAIKHLERIAIAETIGIAQPYLTSWVTLPPDSISTQVTTDETSTGFAGSSAACQVGHKTDRIVPHPCNTAALIYSVP